MQLPEKLLMRLLLLLAVIGLARASDSESHHDNAFTPKQLARARERLAGLFDDSLDTDRDGKLTQAELAAWLARAAAEQASKDAEDSWRLFNVSDGGSLDWDSYVATSRMAALARSGGPAGADDTSALLAEVRRAIEEASRETGIDKAGIKVSLPPLPPKTAQTIPVGGDAEDEQRQQQLAVDLARDRRRWLAADADSDGRLNRREFRDFAVADVGSDSPRMRPVVAAEALERLDTDGNGRVSETEFLGQGPGAEKVDEEAKNFRDVWDADKNGYLEQAEMERMLDYLDSPDTLAKEEAEARDKEAGELMRAADANADGSLSKAEVLDSLLAFAASAATSYGDSVGIHDEL